MLATSLQLRHTGKGRMNCRVATRLSKQQQNDTCQAQMRACRQPRPSPATQPSTPSIRLESSGGRPLRQMLLRRALHLNSGLFLRRPQAEAFQYRLAGCQPTATESCKASPMHPAMWRLAFAFCASRRGPALWPKKLKSCFGSRSSPGHGAGSP